MMTEELKENRDENIVWFRNTDDNRELCVERNSMAARLISRDKAFVRIDGPQGGEIIPDEEVTTVDLSDLSRDEVKELVKTLIANNNLEFEISFDYLITKKEND